MGRVAFGIAVVAAALSMTTSAFAQTSTGPQVIGARSYSPMVESLDTVMTMACPEPVEGSLFSRPYI